MVRLLDSSADRTHRAVPGTERAAFALVGIDLVMQKLFALLRGASLVDDMFDVLFAELAECGGYRVGSCLAESAEAGDLHVGCQLLDLVQLLERCLAGRDVVQHLQQTVRADTAG